MRLGGVDLPFDRHLDGHSDADVLLHAMIDALLGAAGLGDIGELFPNTAEVNRDRDSAEILAHVVKEVSAAGFLVVHVDCIVFAERPRLAPHKLAMRHRMAEIMNVAVDRVGLKGKTGERVGPVGREEAIQAQCVALLEKTA